MKPLVFIGSSSEGLQTARRVAAQLEPFCQVRIWTGDVFRPGQVFLESLVESAKECHFGVFVFTPDDLLTIRGSKKHSVRDNVLFECGLFIGLLGTKRSFFLIPEDRTLHIPTDLLGVGAARYKTYGSKGVRLACVQLRGAIERECHEREAMSLNGKWAYRWSVRGGSFFRGTNRGQADVLHIGDQVTAMCRNPKHSVLVRGTIDRTFITGEWGSLSESLGFFGAFQLRILPRGHRLEGKFVGFRGTGIIASGTWTWTRRLTPQWSRRR